jgi:type I restriction enzyme S subunit
MENGKIAVARGLTNGVGCGTTEFHVLRSCDGIDADYVRYFLLQRSFRRDAERNMRGAAGQRRVPSTYLETRGVPVAPSNEQRRIVDKIDELFSDIEEGERALERARKLLHRYRQAVLKAAVSGELSKDWREKHKGEIESGEALLARILKTRREAWEQAELAKLRAKGLEPNDNRWKEKYREPTPSDTADLPEIPEEWTHASCDSLVFHLTSGSRDWKQFYGRGAATFIMAQNVRAGRYDDSLKQVVDPPAGDPETERTRVRKGDLLVTIVGANTGDVCTFTQESGDHYVCQSVALMRPWSHAYSEFLNIYFQAEEGGQRQYKRYIYGAGRPHLSFDQLRQTAVAVPSETEAAEIAERARARFLKAESAGIPAGMEM